MQPRERLRFTRAAMLPLRSKSTGIPTHGQLRGSKAARAGGITGDGSHREKLRLDLARGSPLPGRMAENNEVRTEAVRRLFYLITITAEDAAAMAAEGQSSGASGCRLAEAAAHLRAAGELIEIAASALELLLDSSRGAGT